MTKEEKQPKVAKTKVKKVLDVIGWVICGIIGTVFLFMMAGNIDGAIHRKENAGQTLRFGYGNWLVLSESMEPVYKKDTVIITYKENIEKVYDRFVSEENAIIDATFLNVDPGLAFLPDNPTYTVPIYTKAVMTHRIMEVHKDETKDFGKGKFIFVTAGINPGNNSQAHQYQVFTESEYLGIVKYNSAGFGKFYLLMTSFWGYLIILGVPGTYLIVISAIDVAKAFKGKGSDNDASPSTTQVEEEIEDTENTNDNLEKP